MSDFIELMLTGAGDRKIIFNKKHIVSIEPETDFCRVTLSAGDGHNVAETYEALAKTLAVSVGNG